jgi:hypothetical protein
MADRSSRDSRTCAATGDPKFPDKTGNIREIGDGFLFERSAARIP